MLADWPPVFGLPLWAWIFVIPSVIAGLCLIAPQVATPVLRPLWRVLDGVYFASGVIAALFMVTILGLIVANMVCRWIGVPFPGSTSFAGYAMAATSFFALAHALTRGAHIRVSLLLNWNTFTKRWVDLLALWVAAITVTAFARFAVQRVILSEMITTRTQETDKIPEWLVNVFALPATPRAEWSEALQADKWVYTPVWIPQLSMAIGTILLAICMWDMLCRTLAKGEPQIVSEAIE